MATEKKLERHFAVSKSGVLASIEFAHKSPEDYFCPHCGCRMMKRCGNIRRWHFAHDWRYAETDLQKNCSYESYLHSYAKIRLKQWFEESKSIKLTYQQHYSCPSLKDCVWRSPYHDDCTATEQKICELKEHLNLCAIEQEVIIDGKRYRPDLLWFNSDKPNCRIFIEINVTHECTDKKKQSSARIIEFDIQYEEDVEYIVSHDIQESETVHFYGFKTDFIDDREDDKHVPPTYKLNKFILYKSGKCFPKKECTCRDYQNRHSKAKLEFTMVEGRNLDKARQHAYGLAIAKSRGIDVRNCYMCSNHRFDQLEKCPKCIVNSAPVKKGHKALECEHFSFNDSYFKKMIPEVKDIELSRDIDIWQKRTDK